MALLGKTTQVRSEGGQQQATPFIAFPQGRRYHPGIRGKFVANPTTGAGNAPLGLGWNLSLHITRKTDKKLPQYCEKNLRR